MRDIHTTIMGNATADPSQRTHDGTVTALVRIAVTGRYFDASKSDFTDRKTEFITVFARRQLARNLLASVKKGQPLIVTGRLSSSEWTDEDDTPRHSLNLQAEAIGHDLTYGTATFTKPMRLGNQPDVDHDTGEIRRDGADQSAEAGTADEAEAEDSLEPAF